VKVHHGYLRKFLRYMKKLTLTLLYTVVCILTSFANNDEGRGTIRGKVTTANGEPAASVTVLLKSTKRGAATDENGYFEFKKLKPENYTLQISLTGHESLEQNIELKENQAVDLNFQLQLSGKQLYEVIVVGGKNKFGKKESNYSSKLPLTYIENPQVYIQSFPRNYYRNR
jgi:iron complex outermembrane recepter protein